MIIRQDQRRAFEIGARERFERAAFEHLRKELPDQVAAFGDEQLGVWIRDAIRRSKAFNLTTERQIMCFLDAEALLGERFYETQEHLWAAQVLGSKELNEQDKSRVLLATACSVYRERTSAGKGQARV